MASENEETELKKTISEENQMEEEAITLLPQSTQINKAEVTDTKPDQMSDQPEEEYGFMEPMTLDSDDEDEVENVPKSVPEIVPEIVPNRQKSPEPENDAQDKEDVNIESITIDSENKDEVKI